MRRRWAVEGKGVEGERRKDKRGENGRKNLKRFSLCQGWKRWGEICEGVEKRGKKGKKGENGEGKGRIKSQTFSLH